MTPQDKVSEKQEAFQKEAFERWQAKAETQMMLSLLPPSVNDTQQECLLILLKGAFTEAFAAGAASVAVTLLSAMMERDSGTR